MTGEVHHLQSAPPPQAAHGGRGNGNGGDLSDRLARLETHMGYVAKAADLEKMESKMLKWQIGILITVVIASCLGTAALVVRLMATPG